MNISKELIEIIQTEQKLQAALDAYRRRQMADYMEEVDQRMQDGMPIVLEKEMPKEIESDHGIH